MAALPVSDLIDLSATRDQLAAVMLEARRLVLRRFQKAVASRAKNDGSPISEADEEIHFFLSARLPEVMDIPIVSEEGIPSVSAGEPFWVVDPLDGTKEFLQGIPEFTINAAIIVNGRPVVGAVEAPGQGRTCIGIAGEGAWVSSGGGNLQPLESRSGSMYPRIAVSRFHADAATQSFLGVLNEAEYVEIGSALKFCALAGGEAEIYPRFGRTMEWDTAAGQCVLEACGGKALSLVDGLPVQYGKPEYANSGFIALAPGFRAGEEVVTIARELVSRQTRTAYTR
jgi:3'(2'), 5'-bisphosphate nucleotidase